MASEKVNVLLIEDDDVAAEAVTRSLQKFGVNCNLEWAEDGREGLKILRGEHPDKRIGKPRIVLLDLNMPRMNGFEFLDELRSDEVLTSTVVFVLTTSDSDADRIGAYARHVAGYMIKSTVGPQFGQLCRFLTEYTSSMRLE